MRTGGSILQLSMPLKAHWNMSTGAGVESAGCVRIIYNKASPIPPPSGTHDLFEVIHLSSIVSRHHMHVVSSFREKDAALRMLLTCQASVQHSWICPRLGGLQSRASQGGYVFKVIMI